MPVLDEEATVEFAAGHEAVGARKGEGFRALQRGRRQRAQSGRARRTAGGVGHAFGPEQFEAVGVRDEQRAFTA